MANPYIILYGANTTAIWIYCDKEFRLQVTTEQVRSGQAGELIQEAMPDLPRSDRELFLSGACVDCWRKIFGSPPAYRVETPRYWDIGMGKRFRNTVRVELAHTCVYASGMTEVR